MKTVFLSIACCAVLAVSLPYKMQAQFLSATVRVDGLTCSLCHLSVHKAIKKLPFVEEAAPNIDEVSMDLTFKRGAAVSFDKLAKAIQDAGFTIGSLKAKFYFQNVNVATDEHLSYGGALYHFITPTAKTLNGTTEMTLIDKAFIPAEAFEKWSQEIKHECYTTGVAGDCCKETNAAATKQQKPQRVYHVTL
jgi:copper chaperone CopZ